MIFLLGGNEDELDLADDRQATPACGAKAKNYQKRDYLNEKEHDNELIFHDDDCDDLEHELESSAGSCSEDHEDCDSDDSCYIAMKSHQRRPPTTKKIINNRNLSTESLSQHQQHNKKLQQPFSSSTRKNNDTNKNTKIFEQQLKQQQRDINSSILNSRHYLTIEDLRSTINSCWLCGCDWREEHVSLDCPECGGYSLSRPCPQCDGQCKQVWCRNLSATHDLHKAFWSGHCDLPAIAKTTGQKQVNCNQNINDRETQQELQSQPQQIQNNKLAPQQTKQQKPQKQQQPASHQHYAVFCNV